MQLTSEQWKNGISNSHYTGVANLRNIIIDDIGVLRIAKKPDEIHELEGTILDLRKNYYDGSFDWYGIVKNRNNTRGSIYQSKNSEYYDGNFSDVEFSGGITFQNYLIPFSNAVNEDAGYFHDTNNDGIYNARGAFTPLISSGSTQTYLEKKQSIITESSHTLLSDTHYATGNGSIVEIKLVSDNSVITTITTANRLLVRVDDTHIGIINQPSDSAGLLSIYEWSNGTFKDSLPLQYNTNDDFKNLQATYRSNGRIVLAAQVIFEEGLNEFGEELYLHRIELDLYKFDGTTLSTDGSRNPLEEQNTNRNFRFDFFISGIGTSNNGRIVLAVKTITNGGDLYTAFVFSKSGFNNWEALTALTLTRANFGAIAQIDDNRVMILGSNGSILSWNESSELLSTFNSNIGRPVGEVQEAWGSDGFLLLKSNQSSLTGVYELVEGSLEYTPAILGQDDVIYYANGNNVASLQEVAGTVFDPTDSDTYFVNFEALDLPKSTIVTAFGEVERYLAIGTKGGKIYFWDRLSGQYDFPVNIGEPISEMGTKNNLLYVIAQDSGNVYVANLSSFNKIKNLAALSFERFGVYSNGIEFFDDGVYLGGDVTQDQTYTGIWTYRNNVWTLLSSDGAVEDILKSSPNELIFSTKEKIYSHIISGAPVANWTDDEAYIVTAMAIEGTVTNKSRDTKLSLYFDNKFAEGEFVKVYFRTTTRGEWQFLTEATGADLGEANGLHSFVSQLSVPKVEQVQYKIVLNTLSGMVKFETN